MINLHFFAKDEYGVRYLRTEKISFVEGFRDYHSRFDWMGRLDSSYDLYVIPQVRSSDDGWTVAPGFDESKATPILVKK